MYSRHFTVCHATTCVCSCLFVYAPWLRAGHPCCDCLALTAALPVRPAWKWPCGPLQGRVGFEHGEAVSLDGERLPGAQLLARLNGAFARSGVGRGVYIGDTTIGLKGRIVYEAPGLIALLAAHRALADALLSKHPNRFTPTVARRSDETTSAPQSLMR